ncbi:MAG: cytochrome P460 family protein [Candidatus Acidiferrales bacterium]
MRQVTVLILAIAATGGLLAQQAGHSAAAAGQPQYVDGNRLVRPQNYREWIYLSSGLGMAYSANANTPPAFTNVFVAPSAYRVFVATGRWPDKTIFVLEEREAASKGSINKGGHFQTDLQGIAAAVKDENRFPEKWAYFNFGLNAESAPANPKQACWQCHNQHGAVDNTFVQFYPTLKPIAMKLGTYKPKD